MSIHSVDSLAVAVAQSLPALELPFYSPVAREEGCNTNISLKWWYLRQLWPVDNNSSPLLEGSSCVVSTGRPRMPWPLVTASTAAPPSSATFSSVHVTY